MKSKVVLFLVALALTPVGLAKEPKSQAVSVASADGVVTLTTRIKAVDPAKRTVTVKGALGRKLVMRVDDKITNLDQIKPGDDVVVVKYSEAVLLKLEKSAVTPRAATAAQIPTRVVGGKAALKGEPATLYARVHKIDAEHNMVLLDGAPKGGYAEVKVKDPNVMNELKLGESVIATFTPPLVIAIQASAAQPPQQN